MDDSSAPRADELDKIEPEPIGGAEEKALAQATLYLRVIRSLDRRAARIERDYRREREPIDEDLRALDEWREDQMSGIRRKRASLVAVLEQFGRAWRARTGHAPARLPYGRVTLTPPKPSVVVTDLDAFVDWAEGKDRLDLIRYTKEPAKDEIKLKLSAAGDVAVPDPDPAKKYQTLMTPDGEPVPGIALATAIEHSVSVKPDPIQEEES